MQDQWCLGAGSLIGPLQHHDLTPWDDDADAPEFGTYAQDCRGKLFLPSLTRPGPGHLSTSSTTEKLAQD
ncbi:hypothetical protein TSMEX_004227 [Taenia solium]